MTRGGTVETTIHDLSGSGSGVGRLDDGRVVFVPRTAVGDRVRVRIVRARKTFANAELVEIVEPADTRRDAPCPLYDRCGGCQLQHVAYRHQTAWKGRRILETLRRVGGVDASGVRGVAGDAVGVEPSPSEFHYRNRVRFTLRRIPSRDVPSAPPRVVAGFHDRDRPGHIVDVVDECLLPETPILRVWGELRRRWGPGARRLPDGEELSLTLRMAVEGVVLVVEGGSTRDTAGRAEAEALVEEIDGLLAFWHRPGQSELLSLLAGDAELSDPWFGEVVPVGSRAFLQVNRELGEALHLEVLKEIGNPAGLRIVDAYCGVGAYGRRLARHGAEAIGIELDPDAVEAARRDAPDGWTVRLGRVEEILPTLPARDRLIVNPPRAGLDEAVTTAILAEPAATIVYVSCDPATLARDLSRLADAYRVVRVNGYDLFPQTAHVETVVTLNHRNRAEQER